MKQLTAALIAFCSLALIWAVGATMWGSRQAEKCRVIQGELNVARKNIAKMEEEAEGRLREANAEADRILAEVAALREQSEKLVLKEQQRLHEVYGRLHKYESHRNAVNREYVDFFLIRGSQISVTMSNKTQKPISPDFKILFVNEHGFVTDSYSDHWLISTVKPGETRVSEGSVFFKFGPPVYFAVFLEEECRLIDER